MKTEITAATATHANRKGYSDVEPYEITLLRTEKMLVIRLMDATLAEDWKPEIIPGGFAGHCVNQHTQRWDYKQNRSYPEFKIRLHKDGKWRDKHGNEYRLNDHPVKFHDYNF